MSPKSEDLGKLKLGPSSNNPFDEIQFEGKPEGNEKKRASLSFSLDEPTRSSPENKIIRRLSSFSKILLDKIPKIMPPITHEQHGIGEEMEDFLGPFEACSRDDQ